MGTRDNQTDETIAEAMYAFQTTKFPSADWWDQMLQDSNNSAATYLHQYYNIQAQNRPETISDTACHRFSVLSFFLIVGMMEHADTLGKIFCLNSG
jgi:hypothetical protein